MDRDKKDIVIFGAGNIGAMVADLLASSGSYRITLADRDPDRLSGATSARDVAKVRTDVESCGGDALPALLRGKFAVLSALPYHLTTRIAEAARAVATHYLDLTEDVASTRRVRELADGATSVFIPQCGLAPGFVSVVANDLARRFDTLDSIRLRVGALPQFSSNALHYNLTWSTEGVVNEYCEPCEAIVDGLRRETMPLEEREEFHLDGMPYEAFNTSGGLGTLCDTYRGRVRQLNYRTIRYPGHAAIMKTLLNDLRLRERRDVLRGILEEAIPATLQDVVIIFVTVTGWRDGRLMQENYTNKIYGTTVAGRPRSAIQITTAAGICTMLDLLRSGAITSTGFVRHEEVGLDIFLRNRFGQVFTTPASTEGGRNHGTERHAAESLG
jgi:saccharopine dehydrogenase-like NADP-dependent oxidoreductase